MTAIHPGRQPATLTDGTLHPVTVQQLAELLADLLADHDYQEQRVADAYRDGYEYGHRSGWDVGYAHAHEEIAAAWALVAEKVRATGRTCTNDERREPGGIVYERAMARRHGQTQGTA